MRFVQLVMGPAGVGKSTYCKVMQEHCQVSKRTLHVANLDPAAEHFEYEPAFDVKELINLETVMNEQGFGPNGGLVYCMEHLLQNLDWLRDNLEDFGEEEYIILDCPGQVELYSHLPVMHNIAEALDMWGFRVVSVYLLDALFVLEPSKFISGCMLSLSCMLQMATPHINVITKCDLADKDHLNLILESEGAMMINALDKRSSGKLRGLTEAIASVVDDYLMVSFTQLDITDEDSVADVLMKCDMAIQYGEDAEPKEPDDKDEDGGDGGDDDGGNDS